MTRHTPVGDNTESLGESKWLKLKLVPLVVVGLVQEVPGPIEVCTAHALHVTYRPSRWKGERLWVVALYGEVQTQKDKLGALKREIPAEIKPIPAWAQR